MINTECLPMLVACDEQTGTLLAKNRGARPVMAWPGCEHGIGPYSQYHHSYDTNMADIYGRCQPYFFEIQIVPPNTSNNV